MSAYRNFDKALEEKRAQEKGAKPGFLVVFHLGGEDFSISDLPGSVLFRLGVVNADSGHYNPDTPEGRAAIERDGAEIMRAMQGVFRDFVGEAQFPRVLDAIARTRMSVPELFEFVNDLAGWVVEEASARPTQPPVDSPSSSPPNGTPESKAPSGSDLALVQALS